MSNASNARVARAALIVMVGFLLSKVAGVARQLIIARVFGPTAELDAYFAAFTAPDLIFMLISGGALATAFIPIFSEYLNLPDEQRGTAWRMASNVLTVSLAISAAVAAVAALLAPWIVGTFVAPGFSAPQQALTVTLMRLILLSTVIFSVSGLVTGVLHSLQHFLLPAFAPLLYNLGIVFGAVVLVPLLPVEQRIWGLAWGSVIGAAMHLLIQLPALAHFRFRPHLIFDLRDPGLRDVAVLMAPRALALAVISSKVVLRSNLASRLGDGSLSALDFAWDLMQLPETLFGTAIALAIFPTLAELWAQDERARVVRIFNQGVRTILALTVPAAVGLIVLGTPLVRAFYEGGQFDQSASQAVSYALSFFAFGIVGHSLLEIVARLFYAQKDTVRPLIAAVLMLGVTAAVAVGGLEALGIGAIALGDTVGVFVEVALLGWWLRYRLPGAHDRETLVASAKIGLASGAMAAVLLAWQQISAGQSIYVVAAVGVTLGGLVYGVAALLLGLEEVREVPRLVLRRRVA